MCNNNVGGLVPVSINSGRFESVCIIFMRVLCMRIITLRVRFVPVSDIRFGRFVAAPNNYGNMYLCNNSGTLPVCNKTGDLCL